MSSDSEEEPDCQLNDAQIHRWYTRGQLRMRKELRVENIVSKLLAHDIYIKELMQLNVAAMSRVKYSRHHTVNVDTESSGINTAEEDAENAADDCEHEECHRIYCKRNQ